VLEQQLTLVRATFRINEDTIREVARHVLTAADKTAQRNGCAKRGCPSRPGRRPGRRRAGAGCRGSGTPHSASRCTRDPLQLLCPRPMPGRASER
jgi:hypothetical protein